MFLFLDMSNFYFRIMNKLSLVIPFILIYSVVFAQVEKIDTDRPDQTESANTVPKKWMQFELGFLMQTDTYSKKEKDITYQHPTLLTRYGLTNNFELRLITTYGTELHKNNHISSNRKTGMQSVQVGGKLNIVKEKQWQPTITLIAHYDIRRFQTPQHDSVDGANFKISLQHTLSKKISLGYNLGMEWENFSISPAYTYTIAPGIDFNENWYGYVELFGSIYKNEKPQHRFDAGLAWYAKPDLKFDISAGTGISKEAAGWYIAVGGSYRFKTGK